MDCNTARLMLTVIGPCRAELTEDDREVLEDHLADCPQCRVLAETERRLDDHLGRAIRDVPMPLALQDRLAARLTRERRNWYRRQALRGAGALAAAATLALGAWLWLGRHGALPGVDLEAAWYQVYEQSGSPPERVREWFQKTYNVQTLAPASFDYNSLRFYDLAEFQGKRVPLLLFIRDGAHARVYILPRSEFDLDQVTAAPGYNVALLQHPNDSQFAYVAVYSSDHLDWFLDKRADPQVGLNDVPGAGTGAQ